MILSDTIDIMRMKKCLDCDTKIVVSAKSGRCIKCYMRIYGKNYYQKNKKEIVEKHKNYRNRFTSDEWKAKNRDKMRAYRLRNKENAPYYITKLKYGLDKTAFIKLFNEQHNQCAICKKDLELGSGKIHVDHDHTTNTVRGLLCHQCNVGLGHFGDNRLTLMAAIRYLEKQSPTCHPERRVAGNGLCNTCYRAKLRYVSMV